MRWQDEIYLDTDFGRIRQKAYAIYGLQASYELNGRFELNANLDNLSDEKHLTSLYYDQAFYGRPRSFAVNVRWKY
jgi:outer membrane receptor for ferric coprogen and ferric-rhodotorulic acid